MVYTYAVIALNLIRKPSIAFRISYKNRKINL